MANELIVANAAALAALVDKATGETLSAVEYTALKDALQEANAATRAANAVYAGPAAGADAPATFRALVPADIPTITAAKISDFASVAAAAAPVQSVAGRTGAVVLAHTDISGLGAAATRSVGTSIGNVVEVGGDGKISTSVLPALAISTTQVAANEAAMLALTAEPGDVAVRTDVSRSFILAASPASTLANWQELLSPTGSLAGVDLAAGAIPYASGASTLENSPLVRLNANTIVQRNGTNVQALYVYGTFTDADNYERIGLTFTPGVDEWDFRAEVAGTGVNHSLRFFGFINADLAFRAMSLGVYNPLTIRADFPPECYIRPTPDTMDLGGPSNQFLNCYVGHSLQGGRSVDLESGVDAAFLRIANPAADTLVGVEIRYSIESRDTVGHLVEGQTGTILVDVVNQNGTVTATPNGSAVAPDVFRNIGSMGTVEFSTSIAGTNCDVVVNATTSLTATGLKITFLPVVASGVAATTSL